MHRRLHDLLLLQPLHRPGVCTMLRPTLAIRDECSLRALPRLLSRYTPTEFLSSCRCGAATPCARRICRCPGGPGERTSPTEVWRWPPRACASREDFLLNGGQVLPRVCEGLESPGGSRSSRGGAGATKGGGATPLRARANGRRARSGMLRRDLSFHALAAKSREVPAFCCSCAKPLICEARGTSKALQLILSCMGKSSVASSDTERLPLLTLSSGPSSSFDKAQACMTRKGPRCGEDSAKVLPSRKTCPGIFSCFSLESCCRCSWMWALRSRSCSLSMAISWSDCSSCCLSTSQKCSSSSLSTSRTCTR
mmetsp:Transcript_29917/g.71210  ORF Transcript_29917/g.71210 Transcript_29917/m.71210 type:complete len:310 (-) Transcript_29917:319-1248(-)